MADSPRFPVRFDAEALAEDLAHASARGREVGLGERARLEREGIAVSELRACAAEGRDGTRLAGCVKTYMPRPDGPWGMVFTGDREPTPVLVFLAFGVRHPRSPWRPSVYQVADRRLHRSG